MQFQLPIQIKEPEVKINYKDKILMVGSCFTEHIGSAMEELKFSVLQNPNGILFDPNSVCKSLISYVTNKHYSIEDLFQLNEIWNSWDHHSRFSDINKESCLQKINDSQQLAHEFLQKTDWIIITLGSSFYYKLTETAEKANLKVGDGVANCHRAAANWFEKSLTGIEETISLFENCNNSILQFNPSAKIIFTISPVRHVRDGVVENNRSKSRLIEAVHYLVQKHKNMSYFPAYELVIDVLRDYRFYDIDLVHPNYAATDFVMQTFKEYFIDNKSRKLMEEVEKINIARKHKPFQPQTSAHKEFLKKHKEITQELMNAHPFLDLKGDLDYFSKTD